MNAKLIRLAERRACLIEQTAKQRAALAQEAEPLRTVLARADQGLAVVRYLKSHPLWLVSGGGTLIALLGPGRLWRWFGRGLVGLQMVNRIRFR